MNNTPQPMQAVQLRRGAKMANTHIDFTDFEQGPVTILAFRSLTGRQFDHVTDVLDSRPAGWTIDRQVDYDGYALFFLSHHSSSATYIISGRSDQIEVAELQGDDLRALGCFQHIHHAVQCIEPLNSETSQ